MTRRWILAVVIGTVTSACGLASAEAPAPTKTPVSVSPSPTEAGSSSPVTPEPSETTTPEPSPPPLPPAYEPTGEEVYPNAKRLAAAVAHALTNYEVDTAPEELVSGVTADPDRQEHLATMSEPLLRPGAWSRGTVIYPQMGGIHADRVSVMVVVRQQIGTGSEVTETFTRTIDVRLRLRDDVWIFDELASIGGSRPATPTDLAAPARQVLDNPRIGLPDSARWDIERGEVEPALLELMAALAERTPYEVVVLSSGHPFEVFGTDRQSNHTKGRAVDIYLIDGVRLIDARADDSQARALVEWLYTRPEVTEIGSPWALDGYGGRSFTDVVHQDHIHVGVRANPR